MTIFLFIINLIPPYSIGREAISFAVAFTTGDLRGSIIPEISYMNSSSYKSFWGAKIAPEITYKGVYKYYLLSGYLYQGKVLTNFPLFKIITGLGGSYNIETLKGFPRTYTEKCALGVLRLEVEFYFGNSIQFFLENRAYFPSQIYLLEVLFGVGFSLWR